MSDAESLAATLTPDHSASRRRGLFISGCWLINIAVLAGVIIWILIDVGAGGLLEGQWSRVLPEWETSSVGHPTIDEINRRITWLAVLRVAGIASGAGILSGLALGAVRHRQLRSWLAVLTLAAGWLAMLTSIPKVTWVGQRWRIARGVPKLEPLAAELRAHWPREDGASDWLGPYSLYATGTSSVLTPLTSRAEERGLAIRAIERSAKGILRFGVSDQGAEVWLEWHPDGSRPASFQGGLDTPRELEHASALGGGWFATGYSLDGKTPW